MKLKQLQIESVNRRYPNVRVISYDRNVLDVPLLLTNNNAQITFRVTLPPLFPDQPPQVVLLARCAPHALLNQYSVVQHQDLTVGRWSSNSSLADVLAVVFGEFKQHPPKIVSYAPPPPMPHNPQPPAPITTTTGTGTSSATSSTQQQQQQPQPYTQGPSPSPAPAPSSSDGDRTSPNSRPHMQVPTVPSAFPEVDQLTQKQVEELLSDGTAGGTEWKRFFEGLEFVKNLESLYTSFKDENQSIATSNMSKDQELVAMYNRNKELNKELGELKSTLDEKVRDREAINQRYSPMQLLQLLKRKIDEAEEESDAVAERFMRDGGDTNGTTSIDHFIDAFLEKRSLMHMRLAKKDRFEKVYT